MFFQHGPFSEDMLIFGGYIKWKMWAMLGEYPKFVPPCTEYIWIVVGIRGETC